MDAMTDAYVYWSKAVAEVGIGGEAPAPPEGLIQGTHRVRVLDVFCEPLIQPSVYCS